METISGRSRLTKALVAAGLTVTFGISLAAPAAEARTHAQSTLFLNGQGSTFIQPLMARWTFLYPSMVDKSTRINYQGTGSGAGIAAFTSGLVDFAGTDAFMNDTQLKAAGGDVLHIPLTLGPVAVTYNLPGFKGNLQLDGPTLAQIYLGKVTNWNDKAIATLNPGVTLPNQTIVPAHRADGSGTSFIFTNYLSAVSPDFKSTVGAGTLVNFPSGQGGKGTSGVASIVSQTPGGLGYVELSYALARNLPVIAIKNKDGKFVAPSTAGAAADAQNAGALPSDLRALIVNSPGAASYPITGISWALVHQHATNQAKSYALLRFLWWAIHTGQRYSSSGTLRYAALPANVVKLDEAKILSVTYHGKQVYSGR
ncbi:MAG: phosphate transporter substrate-binding protein PhoT family [Chloroflexi bacterium]|nr:phosphate transporter substrate-binding protein PhoT family [Chloroflexota bacterium]